MATTSSVTGQVTSEADVAAQFTGDTGGQQTGSFDWALIFNAAGGSDPTASGFLHGIATLSAGANTFLFASSDPFGAAGDAAPSPNGFSPVGARIKFLALRNLDPTNAITVAVPASNGLLILGAASQGFTLQAGGGEFRMAWITGLAALVAGSNDALTLTPSAGTPQVEVFVIFGP